MNRWTTWAQQLRGRHGRREQRHALGAMVLARVGAFTQVLVASHRSAVHLHVRLGVTRLPSPQAFPATAIRHTLVTPGLASPPAVHDESVRRSDRVVRSTHALTEHREAHTNSTTTVPHRVPLFQETTVRTHAIRTPARDMLERRVTSIHELVRRWRRDSSSIVRVIERQASPRVVVRRELPIAEKTRVLARTTLERGVVRKEPPPSSPQASVPQGLFVPPTAAPVPSPANLDALTSHVIQQLDRRLVAYRERMGRV